MEEGPVRVFQIFPLELGKPDLWSFFLLMWSGNVGLLKDILGQSILPLNL